MGVAGHNKLRCDRVRVGPVRAATLLVARSATSASTRASSPGRSLPLLAVFLFYLVPPLFITAPRREEPAWHRRQRRKRGDARALLRVASASRLLALHHSSHPAEAASAPPMGRGRWSGDDDGWFSRNSRGRSQSRGRGGRWGNNAEGRADRERDDRKENEQLRKELEDSRKRMERQSQAQTARPNAKEGSSREGDWLCSMCNFGTNRHHRQACYRCTAAKSMSFPANATPAPQGQLGAQGPSAGTPIIAHPPSSSSGITSISSPLSSSPPPSSTTSVSMQSWIPQLGTVRTGTFLVPGFAGVPAPLVAPSAPLAAATPQPAPCAKTLKAQLDALLQTRAAVAANPLCGAAVASIDGQVAKLREDLAQAQPLEVALRGTLGAVANARQALQRADSKLAKCEQQVVASVAAYEAAASEAQLCRKQLADAEAATARTAGGHADLRQLFGTDPGAAWAAFRMAAEARCVPGIVDPQVCARAAAAFAEMQAICALLPAQPPAADGAAAAAGGPAAASTSVAAVSGPSAATSAGGGGAASEQAAAQPNGATAFGGPLPAGAVDAGAVAAAAITAAIEQQKLLQSVPKEAPGPALEPSSGPPVVLQPSSPEVPSHVELVAAAALQQAAAAAGPSAAESDHSMAEGAESAGRAEGGTAAAAAAAAIDHQEQGKESADQAAAAAAVARQLREQTAIAAATATPAQDGKSDELVPPATAGAAVGVGLAPTDGNPAVNGTTRNGNVPQPSDDAMGGGACNSVANKRSAEAVAAGRAIAAKAKAKASA